MLFTLRQCWRILAAHIIPDGALAVPVPGHCCKHVLIDKLVNWLLVDLASASRKHDYKQVHCKLQCSLIQHISQHCGQLARGQHATACPTAHCVVRRRRARGRVCSSSAHCCWTLSPAVYARKVAECVMRWSSVLPPTCSCSIVFMVF
jgi:hypothetical protein